MWIDWLIDCISITLSVHVPSPSNATSTYSSTQMSVDTNCTWAVRICLTKTAAIMTAHRHHPPHHPYPYPSSFPSCCSIIIATAIVCLRWVGSIMPLHLLMLRLHLCSYLSSCLSYHHHHYPTSNHPQSAWKDHLLCHQPWSLPLLYPWLSHLLSAQAPSFPPHHRYLYNSSCFSSTATSGPFCSV